MDPKKRREFPIYQTQMAFLAVFAVVCLFSLFAPYSLEPRFGVGVSSPVCHAEIRPLFLKFYIAEYVSVNASLHLKFHPLHPNITRHIPPTVLLFV